MMIMTKVTIDTMTILTALFFPPNFEYRKDAAMAPNNEEINAT